jgi:hypothetical protein
MERRATSPVFISAKTFPCPTLSTILFPRTNLSIPPGKAVVFNTDIGHPSPELCHIGIGIAMGIGERFSRANGQLQGTIFNQNIAVQIFGQEGCLSLQSL